MQKELIDFLTPRQFILLKEVWDEWLGYYVLIPYKEGE